MGAGANAHAWSPYSSIFVKGEITSACCHQAPHLSLWGACPTPTRGSGRAFCLQGAFSSEERGSGTALTHGIYDGVSSPVFTPAASYRSTPGRGLRLGTGPGHRAGQGTCQWALEQQGPEENPSLGGQRWSAPESQARRQEGSLGRRKHL